MKVDRVTLRLPKIYKKTDDPLGGSHWPAVRDWLYEQEKITGIKCSLFWDSDAKAAVATMTKGNVNIIHWFRDGVDGCIIRDGVTYCSIEKLQEIFAGVINAEESDGKDDEQIALKTFYYYYGKDIGFIPANTAVTPEVAIEVLKNLSKGEHAFKPELGKGGCSWFVTEGNPYTGTGADKNIDIPVEIIKTNETLIFNETKLLQMLEEEKKDIELDCIAKYKKFNNIAENANVTKRGGFIRFHKKAAEFHMWDRVGRLVRASPAKVGEVILPQGIFSQQGTGKFAVIADASKVKIKGGISALTKIVEGKSVAVEPVLVEAAETMATKLKWAGKVRKVFRYGGKVLIVVGVASDVYRVYVAEDKVKAVVESVGGLVQPQALQRLLLGGLQRM